MTICNNTVSLTIISGTTPTFIFTLSDEDLDLLTFDHVYVSFARKSGQGSAGEIRLDENELTISGNTVECTLTQAQTISLGTGKALCQINWTSNSGVYRDATEILTFALTQNLINEVVD